MKLSNGNQRFGLNRFSHNHLITGSVVLCLAAFWMVTRPYAGIIHDARLYAVQALNHLYPDRFASDLYFAFGSQDAFTFFSAIYVPLIKILGLSTSHVLLAYCGSILWIFALFLFTQVLFGYGRIALLAMAGVILLHPQYGTHQIFSYGEPFVTPRLFAEALILAALAALLRGRPWLTLIGLASALLLHPLMALSGIGVVLLWLSDGRRWLWLMLAAGIIAVTALGVLDIAPFARIWIRFDSEWLFILQERNPFGFISQWNWYAPLQSLLPLIALALGIRIGSPTQIRLTHIVVRVAAIGLIATLLGGDIARNVLIVNLQPWRALWLATLLGNAWAVAVILRLPAGNQTRKLLFIALAAGLLEGWLNLPAIVSAPVAVCAFFSFQYEDQMKQPLPRSLRLTVKLIVAMFLILLGILISYRVSTAILDLSRYQPFFVYLGVVVGGIALLVGLLCQEWKRSRLAIFLASAFALSAAAMVDRRSEWQQFIESNQVPEDLTQLMAGDETIYWETALDSSLDILWFVLLRPQYYSCLQGSGSMFNRNTALEYRRRAQILRQLNTESFSKSGGLCTSKALPSRYGPTRRSQLASVCQNLPELDLMVLLKEIPGTPTRRWRSPVAMPVFRNGRWKLQHNFFFYRCADLREQ